MTARRDGRSPLWPFTAETRSACGNIGVLSIAHVVDHTGLNRGRDLCHAVSHTASRHKAQARPDAVEARLAALMAGFDDALTTAMPATELAWRLAWLDAKARHRPRSGSVHAIGDGFELDVIAHVLRRRDEVIHLRPKEFGLLALLAAHPGRAYSRRELLDRVWGPDHRGGMRTVDVHVRWLRSKIEACPERPEHLLTVRGLGYRRDGPQR